MTVESANEEPATFLIEYSDDYDHVEKWLKRSWDRLFMEMLNGWDKAPEKWPQKRSYAMFKDWFKAAWSTDVRESGRDLEPSFEMPPPLSHFVGILSGRFRIFLLSYDTKQRCGMPRSIFLMLCRIFGESVG